MCAAFTVLAASVSATHKLGSSCGGKHIGTLGCSNDECTVVSDIPSFLAIQCVEILDNAIVEPIALIESRSSATPLATETITGNSLSLALASNARMELATMVIQRTRALPKAI